MSEFGTKNPCPRCRSVDVIPYPFGTGWTAAIYREHYPDAKKCVDCEHVWWTEPLRLANPAP